MLKHRALAAAALLAAAGVKMVAWERGQYYLGGRVTGLTLPHRVFPCKTPAEVRTAQLAGGRGRGHCMHGKMGTMSCAGRYGGHRHDRANAVAPTTDI